MSYAMGTDTSFSLMLVDAGMIVPRVEKDNIAFLNDILLIFTGKAAFSFFHKSNDIILMEMVWERLHNSLKTVGFDPKLIVIDYSSYFLIHVHFLPCRYLLYHL